MALITENLQLTLWNDLDDPYDNTQLVDNFQKIDQHDHSGGLKGLQINGQTSIVTNSVGINQLSSNSVGPDELVDKASDADDTLRPVTTDSIRNHNVTKIKLAEPAVDTTNIYDQSVTWDKINPSGFKVPLIVHNNPLGSLPSARADGGSLYEGYLIDYTDNASVGSRNYLWRLRYTHTNEGFTYWDYIGGVAYETQRRTSTSANPPIWATGSGPVAGEFYKGWGGDNYQSFQSFKAPFSGKWKITAGGNAQVESGYNAVFQSSLCVASAGSETSQAGPVDNSDFTTAYAHCAGLDGSTGDQTTAVSTNSIMTINTSGFKYIRQIFGCAKKWRYNTASTYATIEDAPNADFSILFQRMHVEPYKTLRNYSS
jgi:hypothetical protein